MDLCKITSSGIPLPSLSQTSLHRKQFAFPLKLCTLTGLLFLQVLHFHFHSSFYSLIIKKVHFAYSSDIFRGLGNFYEQVAFLPLWFISLIWGDSKIFIMIARLFLIWLECLKGFKVIFRRGIVNVLNKLGRKEVTWSRKFNKNDHSRRM